MMNVPADVAKGAIDALKSTPLILAVILINVVSLVGFGYVLHSVSGAMERREKILEACIAK